MNRRKFLLGSGLAVLAGRLAMNASANDSAPATGAIVEANNRFALAMYQQLAKSTAATENIWFSPLSIEAALAMPYVGARGKTAQEMAKVLGFTDNGEQTAGLVAELSKQLRTVSPKFVGEFRLANAIWHQQNRMVVPAFAQVMNRHFEAGLRGIDFTASEAARKQINDWVSEQTKKQIPDLMPEGSITQDTTMVLANALYFKGNWKTPFDPKQTQNAEFRRGADLVKSVPMMSQSGRFPFAWMADCAIAELPYDHSEFRMRIILPHEDQTLAKIEAKLDGHALWKPMLRPTKIDVGLPRFTMKTKAQLNDALKALGMPTAFSDTADFSGIGSGFDTISEVQHAATLAVDEVGTVATAATGIGITALSLPPQLVVNRPAMLMITHQATGAIVFLGRLANPEVGK
ncbi:serpin family protein [Tuwongella immobilis]|uniref:Serpin domain-containing protein n=1 Tax=Tuwongella immobilis TaxID=692036 RepID=A0A6C2YRS7_9BACT|nr:serpin family protein [Tuwongella immobilis]VIP04044.1 Uncharacterized protein OS=Sorangium cellulosum So0157-2 GN=SCE1572_17565 PE=3 SV=1: Serpin [Tuwongella immobilis]VTS05455.1 Uncharacterized protein OS=Sorangium cellulosum So0157-2 GN=SCE1572_17565 PE=3 SV=1: Serpin [Tuwongella immobilis]